MYRVVETIPKWSTMLVHGLLNHTIGLRHVYYWSLRRDSYCICPLLSTLWLLLFCQVNRQFTLLGYEPFVLLQHLLFN